MNVKKLHIVPKDISQLTLFVFCISVWVWRNSGRSSTASRSASTSWPRWITRTWSRSESRRTAIVTNSSKESKNSFQEMVCFAMMPFEGFFLPFNRTSVYFVFSYIDVQIKFCNRDWNDERSLLNWELFKNYIIIFLNVSCDKLK